MSTYAIVQVSGKQVSVASGDTFVTNKLTLPEGEKDVRLTSVLFVRDEKGYHVGNPTLPGASVLCEVMGAGKGRKLTVYRYRRRKGYQRKLGARQLWTRLKVKEIVI